LGGEVRAYSFFAKLLACVLFVFVAASFHAEIASAQTTTANPVVSDADKSADKNAPQTPARSTLGDKIADSSPAGGIIKKTSAEVWLGFQTIFLSLLTLIVLVFLGRKSDFNADFQKTFLLIVVISAASFLIVAGYTDQQLAPMFSLFGAIVGYLFGRTDAGKPAAQQQQTQAPPANTEN
jgi:hypothetical protein